MPRTVVTGGGGFFGTWIVKHLLDQQHEVIVVDTVVFTKRWELVMSVSVAARDGGAARGRCGVASAETVRQQAGSC